MTPMTPISERFLGLGEWICVHLRHLRITLESLSLGCLGLGLTCLVVVLASAGVPQAQERPTNTPRPTRTPRRSFTASESTATATAVGVTATPRLETTDTPTQRRRTFTSTPTETAALPPTATFPIEPTDTAVVGTATPILSATRTVVGTATRTLRLRTRTATIPPTSPTIGEPTPTFTGSIAVPTVGPPAASPTPTSTTLRPTGASITFRVAGHFQIAAPPAAPAVPAALALVNFNPTADDNADVIVADAASNSIRWGEGNGRGTFHFRPALAVGREPSGLAISDFNADGAPDVAVANAGDGSVTVVLGRGDGRFAAATQTVIGGEPRALVALGGVLAIADTSGGQVVLGGVSTDGAFNQTASISVGTRPVAIVAADINRDGRQDLLVANRGNNSVSVLLANNSNGFNRVATLSTGAGPSALAVGDLDRNGIPDLAVAQSDEGTVSVWSGDDRGGFTLTTTLVAGIAPSAVGIIDDTVLRGVGEPNPDLVVANAGSNDVILFGGRGNLTFLTSNRVVAGRLPVAMVVGQFDNDSSGNADIAVAGSGDGFLGVLRGQGDGSFVAAGQFRADAIPKGLTAGDFDGDGFMDMVAANQLSGNVSFLKGNNRASLNPRGIPTNSAAGTQPQKVASGDFNSDGRRDLAVVLAAGELRVMTGNGDGSFAAPSFLERSVREVDGRDLNLDGRGDIVALRSEGNIASVWLGSSGGLIKTQDVQLTGTPRSLSFADANGDNVPDLYVGTSSPNTLEIFAGAPPFQSLTRLSLNSAPTSLEAADFDQDGRVDVAVLSGERRRVQVFQGLSGGGFGVASEVIVEEGVIKITAADFNADGFPDLVTASQSTDTVSVYPSDGRGGFSAPTQTLVGRGPADVIAVDLNANRMADIVVSNAAGQTITVLRNVTTGNAPPPTVTPTPGRGTPTVPPPASPRGTQSDNGGGNGSGSGASGSGGCTLQAEARASAIFPLGLAAFFWLLRGRRR